MRPHPVRICPVRVRGRPSASADRSKYFVSKNFQVPSRGCMTESTRKIKEQRFCLPQKTLDAYEMGQLARRQHAHLVHSPHVTLKNSEDFYKFLGWRQVPPPWGPWGPPKMHNFKIKCTNIKNQNSKFPKFLYKIINLRYKPTCTTINQSFRTKPTRAQIRKGLEPQIMFPKS